MVDGEVDLQREPGKVGCASAEQSLERAVEDDDEVDVTGLRPAQIMGTAYGFRFKPAARRAQDWAQELFLRTIGTHESPYGRVLSDGRPAHPGRLNDIRYIVYKAFNQSFVETIQNYGVMLREGILKENIDGEALQFAFDRLSLKESDIACLAVVSDGAPIDDSTLSVNGSTYLERHLRHVVGQLVKTDVHLMAVGINTDASRYYMERSIKSTAERVGTSLITLFRRRLQMNPPKKPLKKVEK